MHQTRSGAMASSADDLLYGIVGRIWSSTGENFLAELVRQLAAALNARIAMIGELLPGSSDRMRSVSACVDGTVAEYFEYDLGGTPCANVMGQTPCYYPSGVAQQFPEDKLLGEMGVESYLGAPLIGRNGQALGVLVVLHDAPLRDPVQAGALLQFCAVRVAAELEYLRMVSELRKSELRYKALFEAANDAILVGRDGQLEECNPQALRLFRATTQEIAGKSMAELSPELQPDGRNSKQTAEVLRQRVLDGESMMLEWKCRRLDGTEFDAELSVNAVEFGGDRGIQFLVRDISERKRDQEARQQAEERFEKAFRLSPEPMSIVTLDGRHVDLNDIALQKLGLRSEEVIGRTATELGILVEPAADLFEEFRNCSTIRSRERKFRSRSGAVITLLLSAELIHIGGEPHILVMAPDITDRVSTERELLQSEERFKTAFRSSPIPMAIARLGGGIVDANDTLLEIFGFTLSEALGKTADELGASVEPAAKLREEFQRAGMKIRNRETQYRTRSGELRTFLLSVEILHIQGEPHMLWMGPDITERKTTEHALIQSEDRFKTAFRSSPLPMTIARLNGVIVDANDAVLETFGITLSEAVGKTGEDLGVSVEFKLSEEFQRAGMKIRNRETQYRTRSGQLRTFLISVELIHLQGEPHMLWMGPDITEKKKHEEWMRMLSSATTVASDAIIITDADLSPTPHVLYANPAFCLLTGYSSEELIGRRTSETFGTKIDSQSAAEIQQALLSGNEFHGEIVNSSKDGRIMYMELDIVPVRDSSGAITNYVAVRRDISRRKVEEFDRQRFMHVVFEAQTEERRRISRELHDQAGQLLTSMLLRLEALKQETTTPTVKKAIGELSTVASSTMEELSRLARGLHPSVLDDLGLEEAFRRTLDEFEGAGISATMSVYGMKERLPQNVEHEIYHIVKEALTNARKHSQARHLVLSLEQQGSLLAVSVADDGMGFDCATASVSRAGLGIVGMSERAALLRGNLRVHSRPNAGTVITLTVPLTQRPPLQASGGKMEARQ